MTGQNDRANAIRLLKALVARGANSKEPMANAWITQVALEIGLAGDEFDSALDYAADQGWFDDTEVADNANWVSLTPVGESAGESG
jgi:SOS response regulatory protein OraA/RecX